MSRTITLLLGAAALACPSSGGHDSATLDGFETPGWATAGPGSASGATTEAPGDPTGSDPGKPTTDPADPTAATGITVTAGSTGGDEQGETGPPDVSSTGEPGTGATGATDTAGTTGTTGPGDTGLSTTGGGGVACAPTACEGVLYDCGDCLDNDGDGKVDQADPECVSPCDDREDTFATGLPGDNVDPCKQDCFFDGNSGAGGGDCQWNLKCDPKSPGGAKCPYDPNYNNCPDEQTPICLASCQVPNGCDCFGCCTVVVDGQSHDVFLGDPDCSLAAIEQCAVCTKNPDCSNDCNPDDCELCFGEDELPPECDESTCADGDPCEVDDMGGSTCAEGFYCSTGCCVVLTPG